MNEILHQTVSVPGVVGTLVYGEGGTILASEFPDVFEPSALDQVAAIFGEDTIIMKELTGESAFLDMRYAGGRVVVRPSPAGSFVVLCTSGINLQLLSLSLTQAARRMERAGTASHAASKASRPVPELLPGMKTVREKLKRAVILQLGPIGDMVFERAWNDWSVASPPSKQGLARLVDTLASEIDESPDRQEFVTAARAIIA